MIFTIFETNSQKMKTKLILMFTAMFLTVSVACAYSIRYYNKDSKSYEMEVKVNGSTKKIEFKGSTTSTASVQTTSDKVEIKTNCGWVEVKDKSKITIKDGCITID